MANDEDDDIPLLQDVLRPGDGPPARRAEETEAADSASGSDESRDCPLTDEEIEAIATRVIERHTERMQEAVGRAIRQAIDVRNRERDGSVDEPDDQS